MHTWIFKHAFAYPKVDWHTVILSVQSPSPTLQLSLQSDWLSSDSLGAEHQNKTREQHHSLFYIFLLKKIHPTYPTPVVLPPRICTHLERQESLILAAMEDSWWATDPGKSGTSRLSDTRPKLTLCPDLYVPSCSLGLYPDYKKVSTSWLQHSLQACFSGQREVQDTRVAYEIETCCVNWELFKSFHPLLSVLGSQVEDLKGCQDSPSTRNWLWTIKRDEKLQKLV